MEAMVLRKIPWSKASSGTFWRCLACCCSSHGLLPLSHNSLSGWSADSSECCNPFLTYNPATAAFPTFFAPRKLIHAFNDAYFIFAVSPYKLRHIAAIYMLNTLKYNCRGNLKITSISYVSVKKKQTLMVYKIKKKKCFTEIRTHNHVNRYLKTDHFTYCAIESHAHDT